MPGTTFPANVYPSASSSYRPRRSTPDPPSFSLSASGSPNPNLNRSMADSRRSHSFFDDRVYPSTATYYRPPTTAMYSYHAVPPQGPGAWNSNAPTIQPLMGVHTHSPFPPPPPRQHKVWILDCKACGMFLSNRGMKAVLLLRPNVSLFSTDALPINCSAYSSSPNALCPSPLPLPSATSSSSASQGRTCECLTQTLCCHGCGGMVGYMIVCPCNRCITSTTSNNRTTNGHRFVFHSSEVVGSERHYIPLEPGIIPYDINPNPVVHPRGSDGSRSGSGTSSPSVPLLIDNTFSNGSGLGASASSSGASGTTDVSGYSAEVESGRWDPRGRDNYRLSLIPAYAFTAPYHPPGNTTHHSHSFLSTYPQALSDERMTTRGLRIMNQTQSQASPFMQGSPPPLVLPDLSPSHSEYGDDDDEPPGLIDSSPPLGDGPQYMFEGAMHPTLRHQQYYPHNQHYPVAHSLPNLSHRYPQPTPPYPLSHYSYSMPHLQHGSPQVPLGSAESTLFASSSSGSRLGLGSGSSASSGLRQGLSPRPSNDGSAGLNMTAELHSEARNNAHEASPNGPATVPPTDKDPDSPDPNTATTAVPELLSTMEPALRKLRQGDVLYWHHLKRTGEMLGVEDYAHARTSRGDAGKNGLIVPGRVFAGR